MREFIYKTIRLIMAFNILIAHLLNALYKNMKSHLKQKKNMLIIYK